MSDDSSAHLAAWKIAEHTRSVVVNPGGITMVRNLRFGSNAARGQSSHPPGMCGNGVQTIFRALPGTAGTVINARGLSGAFFRDFMVDCNNTAAVAIDTSWGSVGPSAQNTYDGVWVQNFCETGWLALNDNQSKFKDVVARGATTSLTIGTVTGKFVPGEQISARDAAATGTLKAVQPGATRGTLRVAGLAGVFQPGDLVTGSMSGAHARVTECINGAALSGVRIEGSGGAIFLDNVSVADSFLSLCCQNAQIQGGFSFGIRLNESQVGVNFLAFSGGTQLYSNPTTLSHFEDSRSEDPGHDITSVTAVGLYLISSPGRLETRSLNCALAVKFLFQGCFFVPAPEATGEWRLFGSRARGSGTTFPAIVRLDGCSTGKLLINSGRNLAVERADISAADSGLHSDFPMRVAYRASRTYESGLPANTFEQVVPAAEMTDTLASYLLAIAVHDAGGVQATLLAPIGTVEKTGPLPASRRLEVTPSVDRDNASSNRIGLRYGPTVKVERRWLAGIEVAIDTDLSRGATIAVTLLRVANPMRNF